MRDLRPDDEVDENNNEVSGENNEEPLRPQMKLRMQVSYIILVTLLLVVTGSQGTSSKLKAIQALSPSSGHQEPEICYTDGCLDAAFDLLHAMNLSADPCDNFYTYSCGRWMESNPVPPSSSRWGRFHVLRGEVSSLTQTILNEGININDPRPVNQAKEFYSSCVDVEALEEAGVAPVVELLESLGGWPLLDPGSWDNSTYDWVTSLGNIRRRLLDDPLINIYVERDFKNVSRNVLFLDQPHFGLPRSILIDAPSYAPIISAYRTFIVEVAIGLGSLASNASLEASAQAIIDMEISLAALTLSDEDRYDYDVVYNLYSLGDFQGLSNSTLPGFHMDWAKLLNVVLASSGVTVGPEDSVNVAGEAYLLPALSIFQGTPLSVLADYLGWRAASGVIGETTQDMRDTIFRFTRVLTGATSQESRSSTCAGASNNNFGMAVGLKYIEKAFDMEAKGVVDALVENLRVSFKGLVTEADWMAEATKEAARAKADAILSQMAFPPWLLEDPFGLQDYYAGLELGNQGHFQAVLNIALWSSDKAFKSLVLPTERDEWMTYPGVVNAFYLPERNTITFPAGILAPPFFGKERPSSQNYGGIGVVIGHEITHGFDTQGSQFDGDGNFQDWWDEVTKDEYRNKTQCVIDQYSNFHVPPPVDMYVNGELTQGENVADNGGVRESYRAYLQFEEENGGEEGRLPGLDWLNHRQLFFVFFANIWCESITTEGLINQILTYPHSPAEFRVLGPLRNNVDFAQAFNCPVGSGMNPPVEEKCTVW